MPPFSYCDNNTIMALCQEILYDRGINVSHTTIYRWVQEYGKLLYQIWKKKNKKSFYSWKMDETYIKIKGKWHYLYRAIDADGLIIPSDNLICL